MEVADRVRSNVLGAFLKTALTAFIVIMMIGVAMIFITSDRYDVYAAGVCSASALINCVGLTLILRWHKSGMIFIVFASLLSAIAVSILCAEWLMDNMGNIGIYIPYIGMGLYTSTLSVFLLQKNKGKSAWQQMDNSLDIAHFRHIYQLSIVVLLFISVSAYVVKPSNTETEPFKEADNKKGITSVSQDRLDSPDVTIDEVISFEKTYNENNAVKNRDDKIESRIFAIKHLLLSGLMSDVHSRDNLVNICMVHAGCFSEQQQEIIDWYLSLDISQQLEWNACDKVNTLSEFKEIVQTKIQ